MTTDSHERSSSRVSRWFYENAPLLVMTALALHFHFVRPEGFEPPALRFEA